MILSSNNPSGIKSIFKIISCTKIMCGIIGYLGLVDGFEIAMKGLAQLKNRGYDSAGYCGLSQNHQLECVKLASTENTDSMTQLTQMVAHYQSLIAHCRWATTGPKTDINAHPHLDMSQEIALVHNGTIQNYQSLRQELVAAGYTFVSQTDSEVIVNLISFYYQQTQDLKSAIFKSGQKLRGTWALVIISAHEPEKIYCLRYGSPILIGKTEEYVLIASEQAGFCQHVNSYIVIDNHDLIVLSKHQNKITLETVNGTAYQAKSLTLTSDELSPEPFPHWTLKEIHEQPDAVLRALGNGSRIRETEVQLGGLQQHQQEIQAIEHVIILGCGTSYHAAKYCETIFQDLTNLSTIRALDGTEFTTQQIPKHGKTCLILVSQSGESRDLYRCLQLGRQQNCLLIGAVNVVDSLIAREVDCGCYLQAGREVGVAATKSFTNQVVVLAMMAIFWAQIHQVNLEKRRKYLQALRQLPRDLEQTISHNLEIAQTLAGQLKEQANLFILGRGINVAIAEEGALKIKELSYLNTTGLPLLTMRHGIYSLLEKGTPVIFLRSVLDYGLINNTIEEVKSREGTIYLIESNWLKENFGQEDEITHMLTANNKLFEGLLMNVCLQLIAYYLSVQRNNNVDFPRSLAKSLTT